MSSRRFKFVLSGAVVVFVLSLFFAALSIGAGWVAEPYRVHFAASVVLAPVYLLYLWLIGAGVPGETLTFAIVAIAASPLHPAFQGALAKVGTVAGLIFWALCSLIVAGAPA
jgi:hypothetical protein